MASIPLRVLIIEDRQEDADLIIHALRRSGFAPTWCRVETASAYLDHLHPDLDVILADYTLPQFNAPRALQLLRERGLDIPFIVVTGSISEEVAVACIKQGAADYLLKDRLARLGPAIEHALHEKRLRNEKREAERILREKEEYYRSLIEHTSDIIAVLDGNGAIRFISQSSERVLGYKGEVLLGRDVFALIHPEDLEPAKTVFTGVRRKVSLAQTVELRLCHSDGSWRTLEAISKHLPNEDGGGMIIVNFRDITDRKRHEVQQHKIITLSTVLRTAAKRADMIAIVLDQLLDLLDAEGAALAIRRPGSTNVVIELARGAWSAHTGEQLAADGTIVAEVIATGERYLNNHHVRSGTVLSPDSSHDDVRAVSVIPLTSQDYTIGALCLCRTTPLLDDDVHVLLSIAELVANALNRSTLHEQTERWVHHLAALHAVDMAITASLDLRLTLNVVLDQITTHIGVDAAYVLLLNPHSYTLEYAVGRGFRTDVMTRLRLSLGEGLAGRAALERQMISIPVLGSEQEALVCPSLVTSEFFVAYYAIPLIAKGQVKGVLGLFHRSRLDLIPEYAEFLEAIVTQTAIAIDNTELFEKLQRSNTELSLAYESTLEGWVKALDLRDKETEGHTQRVTQMTVRLARVMSISDGEMVHVRRGALLHDIGKMAIPDNILLKPGPLTEDEWEIMRKHPVYAYEWLEPIAFLRPALDIPYCHHERWDGSGYPRGLRAEGIPLSARIFAVVDVWDALCSDRPYRKGWPLERVQEHIQSLSGVHFDPQVVAIFLEYLSTDACL